MQPVLARISGQIFCAWQAEGKLVVARDSGRTPLGSFSGLDAAMAASPDGREGYLVWENADGGNAMPQFAILR